MPWIHRGLGPDVDCKPQCGAASVCDAMHMTTLAPRERIRRVPLVFICSAPFRRRGCRSAQTKMVRNLPCHDVAHHVAEIGSESAVRPGTGATGWVEKCRAGGPVRSATVHRLPPPL